jgi:hypothetical protein
MRLAADDAGAAERLASARTTNAKDTMLGVMTAGGAHDAAVQG